MNKQIKGRKPALLQKPTAGKHNRKHFEKSVVLFVLLCGLNTVEANLEKPEIPPTTPYDPSDPDQDPATIPLPPDTSPQPQAPVREPDQPPPIIEPSTPEPTRL